MLKLLYLSWRSDSVSLRPQWRVWSLTYPSNPLQVTVWINVATKVHCLPDISLLYLPTISLWCYTAFSLHHQWCHHTISTSTISSNCISMMPSNFQSTVPSNCTSGHHPVFIQQSQPITYASMMQPSFPSSVLMSFQPLVPMVQSSFPLIVPPSFSPPQLESSATNANAPQEVIHINDRLIKF